MPEHYAVQGLKSALAAVTPSILVLKVPAAFTLTELTLSVGAANAAGAAVFDINAGPPGGPLASIFAAPADRPSVAAGQTSVTKAGLNVALPKGHLLTVDLDAYPLGGVAAPVFLSATFNDGRDLRSTLVFVTPEIADGESLEVSIPGMGRGWVLLEAESDRAARLRIYTRAALRTADAARPADEDAEESAGLCCEILFAADDLSPAWGAPFPEGYNLDDPASTAALATVDNLSGADSTVQLSLNRIVREK